MKLNNYELVALIAKEIQYSLDVELRIEREGNDTKVAQIALEMLARRLENKFSVDPEFDSQTFKKVCKLV